MKFTKMHGLGNDFVMVNGFLESLPEKKLPEIARQVCDRHFGVGADGLILALPSQTAALRMRIFNADGSEAEMCGNGVRCFARFVRRQGLTNERRIPLETLAGLIVPEILDEPEGARPETGPTRANGNGCVIVDMGPPRLRPSEIPMLQTESNTTFGRMMEVDGSTFEFTAVSMGNPHCVLLVDDVRGFPVGRVGPLIERHPLFPRKTNVEFVQPLLPDRIRMRVWERGDGETLACGTGACAAVVACSLNRKTGRRVHVELARGELLIEWREDNHVYMMGPTTTVYEGEIELR